MDTIYFAMKSTSLQNKDPNSMKKRKIIFVRTNLLNRDYRLSKEIKALKRVGHSITLLCWDRECRTSLLHQEENNFKEIRVRLKAPWGVRVLLFLPIWWCFAFFRLMSTQWDVAHAVNFDSIVPVAIAGKLKRKLVIYEILETYEDRIAFPKILRDIFIHVDKTFMRFANAVVIADEAQVEEFDGIPSSKVVPVYDSSPDFFKKPIVKKNDTFTLFYAGALYKIRQLNLDKIVLAVSNIDNVKVIIAGYGDLAEEIEKWSHQVPNKIQFIGKISQDEVFKRTAAADLVFVLRNPVVPEYKYICGSTILNNMMCGTPILANKGTSTADKVYKENCGLVMDADNIEEIREAIIKLRDNPELCEKLGANGRRAYEGRYSWAIMEQRLVDLYGELTGEVGEEDITGEEKSQNLRNQNIDQIPRSVEEVNK